jgi:preprotein translocase SecF subunit
VRNAVLAVGAASVFILLYLWWAFSASADPWSYGSAALAGLLHDAFAVLGLFSILGRLFAIQLESTFIVAVLTVIGFSVHDSIVVFDRVRENLVRRAGEPFEDVVNHSIAQTLTRSLNTTVTVVLTLLVLTLFGGTSGIRGGHDRPGVHRGAHQGSSLAPVIWQTHGCFGLSAIAHDELRRPFSTWA